MPDGPATLASSDVSRGKNKILWQDGRGNAICRICATADGDITSSRHGLPQHLVESDLLGKIDAIYHASSHAETCSLRYLDRAGERGGGRGDGSDVEDRYDEEEEMRLVSILRSALEDAGFERLRRRDLDLCEALNAGYLLRLSILPDVKSLDPCVGREFFPELSLADTEEHGRGFEKLLFDGRVLVFRRGYSEEVTEGRLLLPKIDYLQASVVQRSAAAVTSRLGIIERKIGAKISKGMTAFRRSQRKVLSDLADRIPAKRVSDFAKSKWGWKSDGNDLEDETGRNDNEERKNKVLKLGRYGGSKTQFVTSPDLNDALNPFLVCEVDYDALDTTNKTEALAEAVNNEIYKVLNTGQVTCDYDAGSSINEPIQLLKRVSISNLVDFFSPQGRKGIIRGFVEKAKLVEPTYKEVVVVYRPLPKKIKPKIRLPQFLYDAAEIFEWEDRLPEKPKLLPEPKPAPLKIRAFTDVPMANLLAVLPKTKLIFRPADALVFDTVSVFSLGAVLASQRFDNPKFDVIAVVSVTLWVIRTFFRYSNKYARYENLVNKFLTSRISHRGPGALKYLATEAGSQRATRAGLLYSWLQSMEEEHANRRQILQNGRKGMNSLLGSDRPVKIDVGAALDDLTELGAIRFCEDGETIEEIISERQFREALKEKWLAIF